jgi:predicted MFS family arabinose efflux permease
MRLIPAGVAIIAVTYGLARYAYGLFLPEIRADFGLSTALLSVIASGSYAAFLLGTTVSSVISARTGPRLPVAVGGLSAAAGMLLVGIAQSPLVLAVGVVLAGSGAGWAYPPMPDAVARLVAEENRGRALTAINSGTSYGVILAGPVALLAGSAWWGAWLVFAALALAATVWNAALLPGKPGGEAATLPRLRWSWFVCPRSGPLLVSAFALGLTSTVYWTYAVDLVSNSGALPRGFGELFFVLIGAAGVFGALAGGLVGHFGIRPVLRLTVLALAASLAALPLAFGSPLAVAGSGLLFGATFIMMTGTSAVWAMQVFRDRPSAGLGAYLLVFSVGQLLGPLLVGVASDLIGIPSAFYAAGAVAAATALLGPAEEDAVRIDS